MKAVQLITSGDYQSHYLIDDHESWKEEVRVHEGYGLDSSNTGISPAPSPVSVRSWSRSRPAA